MNWDILELRISGSGVSIVVNVLELTCNILFLQIIIRVLTLPVRIMEYARRKVRRSTPVSASRAPLMNQSRCATIKITLTKVSASTNTRSAQTERSLVSSIMEAANVSVLNFRI